MMVGAEIVVENTFGLIVQAAVVAGVLAVVWATFVNRSKVDAATRWKELHDANEVEIKKLKDELAELRARLSVLESGFVERVAEEVAKAVTNKLREE